VAKAEGLPLGEALPLLLSLPTVEQFMQFSKSHFTFIFQHPAITG